MTEFRAYRIDQDDGKVVADFATMNLDNLTEGEVVIKVSHSTINYKDALAATGVGRILRKFPLNGGIDLAGTRARVEKHMNAEPRRIGRLPVQLTIEGAFSDDEKKVLERTAHTCPVHKSLHPDIDAPISITWT